MRFPIRFRARPRLIGAALSDRRGATAVIMALCAPVLMLMIGFAIDYGYALNVNQRLNGAADAAVLAATSPSATAQAGGIVPAATSCNGGSPSCWSYQRAIQTFLANELTLPIPLVVPTISISTSTSNKVTATLTYSTSVPTFFSGIIGMSSIPISGHAQATASPLTYVNYYILLDVSNSMGIAASPTEQTALYNQLGCQFGCHVPDTGQTVSNESVAHSMSPAVTLRIDAAKTAILEIINTAANLNTNGNIKIGLYTMNQDPTNPTNYVTQVLAPTTSQSALTTAVGNIDLGNNTVSNGSSLGDTNYSPQFAKFTNSYFAATSNGTGLTPSSPLNYILIVTDGVQDTNTSSCSQSTQTGGHCVSVFSPSLCTSLQSAATVAVLYTTYDPIYQNPNKPSLGYTASYSDLVAPFASQILGNLESCASSSQYFLQADEGSAIISAAQTLFANTLQTARLTQ
jgi:Flp pilus assembly protein TadG